MRRLPVWKPVTGFRLTRSGPARRVWRRQRFRGLGGPRAHPACWARMNDHSRSALATGGAPQPLSDSVRFVPPTRVFLCADRPGGHAVRVSVGRRVIRFRVDCCYGSRRSVSPVLRRCRPRLRVHLAISTIPHPKKKVPTTIAAQSRNPLGGTNSTSIAPADEHRPSKAITARNDVDLARDARCFSNPKRDERCSESHRPSCPGQTVRLAGALCGMRDI